MTLVAYTVKNLPTIQETWVWFLGQENPLKKGMATHSSILAWKNPMDRGAWQANGPWGHKESDTTEQQNTTNNLASCLREGLFFASWDLHGCSVGSHWETLQEWSCQRRRASKNGAINGADWQMLSHPCGSPRSVGACILQSASGTSFSCKLFHVSDSLQPHGL